MPPDRMVSVSSDRRVWLRRICSFSSSMRCSRSRSLTAYVAPSMPPALVRAEAAATGPGDAVPLEPAAGAAAAAVDAAGEGAAPLAEAAGAAEELAAAAVLFFPAPAVFFPVCASAGAIASTGTNSATQSVVFAERIYDPFFRVEHRLGSLRAEGSACSRIGGQSIRPPAPSATT